MWWSTHPRTRTTTTTATTTRLWMIGPMIALMVLLTLVTVQLPRILHVEGASQMPGLPIPIDTFHSVSYHYDSILPKDAYTITAGYSVYTYNPVTQLASYIGTTADAWTPAYGCAGILISSANSCATNSSNNWGRFNSTTIWSNNNGEYWFAGHTYWKWKPVGNGNSPGGPGDIENGWMSGIPFLDGWVTSDYLWSYAFVGPNVYRYDNQCDCGDTSQVWPQDAATLFGPNFPLYMDDVDTHHGSQRWINIKNNTITLYNPETYSPVPNYPRNMHDDDIDGGTNGIGRTSCSGTQDLSTIVGFIEDKSPGSTYQAMPYAPNRVCQWTIEVPHNFLKQKKEGVEFSGIDLSFFRFDLGDGAKIEIYGNNDMPTDADRISRTLADTYRGSDGPSAERVAALRAFVTTPITAPTLLATYTSTAPPSLISSFITPNTSLSYTIKMTTTTDTVPGTGFGLYFALASPVLDSSNYTANAGLFWLTSNRRATISTAIIAPIVQAPQYQKISFSLAVNIYPNISTYYDELIVTAYSLLTGDLIYNCTGDWLSNRAIRLAPRCNFQSTGPVKIVYSSTANFVGSVMGEYALLSYCNTPSTAPQLFNTANTGTITDGSGPTKNYAPNSDCYWLIQAPDIDALFISYTLTDFALSSEGSGLSDYLESFDGYNSSDYTQAPTIIRLGSSYQVDGVPIESTGRTLLLHFWSSGSAQNGGLSGIYNLIYPPVLSTVVLNGFVPITTINLVSVTGLLSSVGSTASALVYAKITKETIYVTAADKYGSPAALQYTNWFRFIFRWIPTSLTTNPTLKAALESYPYTISSTTATNWTSWGFTITNSQLSSIVEYSLSGGVPIEFIAPSVANIDYQVVLIYVLDLSHNPASTIPTGLQPTLFPNVLSAIAYSNIVRVTGYKGLAETSSTFLALPIGSANATACTIANSVAYTICNAGVIGLNGIYTAGTFFSLIIISRDPFGNRMEDLGVKSDVRVFLSSDSTGASPVISHTKIMPGVMNFSFQIDQAATDYLLTVLVQGADINEGPFSPIIQPGPTDSSKSTITNGLTGLSLTVSPLSVGTNIPIVLTLRDQYGNKRKAVGSDSYSLTWDNHNLKLLNVSGGDIIYTVDVPSWESASLMKASVNGQPIGYDPNDPSTASFANGIYVAVGSPVLDYYISPKSVEIGFDIIACLCIAFCIGLMSYMSKHRSIAPIRAASPTFLTLMLIGAICCFATLFPLSLVTVTSGSCALEPLLGHLGFLTVFGSLFLKSHRVKSIFQAKKLQVLSITDGQLLLWLVALQGAFIIYWIIWMSVAQPEPSAVQIGYTVYWTCKTSESLFPTILIIAEAIFVAWGAYISASIWSLPSLFNESKFLLTAIYNVVVIGGICVLLVKVLLDRPDVQLIVTGVGIILVTMIVVCVIFVPKIYLITAHLTSVLGVQTGQDVTAVTGGSHEETTGVKKSSDGTKGGKKTGTGTGVQKQATLTRTPTNNKSVGTGGTTLLSPSAKSPSGSAYPGGAVPLSGGGMISSQPIHPRSGNGQGGNGLDSVLDDQDTGGYLAAPFSVAQQFTQDSPGRHGGRNLSGMDEQQPASLMPIDDTEPQLPGQIEDDIVASSPPPTDGGPTPNTDGINSSAEKYQTN